MLRYSLPLALLLASMCAAIPARAQQTQTKRVWTTDDMDDLRARGLISIVETEAATVPAPALPATSATYANRTQDPAWYAEQAAALQTQLAARAAALAEAQNNLVQARSLRANTGSVNLNALASGVTPEESIANLQADLRDAQARLDELADLARRNDVPPGVLRSATA